MLERSGRRTGGIDAGAGRGRCFVLVSRDCDEGVVGVLFVLRMSGVGVDLFCCGDCRQKAWTSTGRAARQVPMSAVPLLGLESDGVTTGGPRQARGAKDAVTGEWPSAGATLPGLPGQQSIRCPDVFGRSEGQAGF